MCDFLFYGGDFDLKSVKSLAGVQLSVADGKSPNVAALRPGVKTWVVVTDGHCSCGLSPLAVEESSEEREIRTRTAKYRKQGFSDAKIERSLAAWKKQSAGSGKPGKGEASRLLVALLSTTHRVFAYSHHFRGALKTERLPGDKRAALTLADVQAKPTRWLEPDTLTEVRSGAQVVE